MSPLPRPAPVCSSTHVLSSPQPEAIVALSPSADNSYLAYPSPVPSPALSQASAAHPHQPSPSPPTAASASAAPATGDVLLFSTRSLTVANVIQAHKSPISFLSVNAAGTLLATASDKGTVIRVWSIPGAEKLYQFRRGTREARIYSINFNLVSSLLCVSSAHDTVHIFKLGQGHGRGSAGAQSPSSPSGSVDSREGSQGLDGGYEAYAEKKKGSSVSCVFFFTFCPPPRISRSHSPSHARLLLHRSTLRRKSLHLTKNLTSSVGGYLPNTLTEMWEPSRDFAFLRLPTSGARCIAALSGYVLQSRRVMSHVWQAANPARHRSIFRTMPQVMVLSSEGYFYSYNIDLENGGECSLMKQYRSVLHRTFVAVHLLIIDLLSTQLARLERRDK